jgi:hypothetical protein
VDAFVMQASEKPAQKAIFKSTSVGNVRLHAVEPGRLHSPTPAFRYMPVKLSIEGSARPARGHVPLMPGGMGNMQAEKESKGKETHRQIVE